MTRLDDEYLEVLNELQYHHALFAEFWNVGYVVEDESIPTAAIRFDEYGEGFSFVINPLFWETLSLTEKVFVLSHECLHVYFDHGRRSLQLENKHIANIAADLVVNHCLVDVYGFDRDDMQFLALGGVDKLCWRDTIFPPEIGIKVEANRSLEYYYNLIMEEAKKQAEQMKSLDDHSGMNGQPQEGDGDEQSEAEAKAAAERAAEQAEKIVDKITRRMSDDEVEDFEEKADKGNKEENDTAKQAGSFAGGMRLKIRLGKVVKKRKWETVVEDVLGRFKGRERDITIEQWARRSRRMSGIDSGDLMIPTEIDEIVPVRDRIDIWFFQDYSGSCVQYAERFFRAAASIPEDRFHVRGFCFDTHVHEVNFRECEVRGGGGTCFAVLEQAIQEHIQTEGIKYPQAVFVITDGYGTNVQPEFPDRWHWFLTDEKNYWGDQTAYIPSQSKYYNLSDYE